MTNHSDIIIAGAGPAGASVSLFLSKQKIPHTIIDSAHFPRDKTCGDGLVPGVFEVLNHLDESLSEKLLASPYVTHSWGGDFISSTEKKYHVDLAPAHYNDICGFFICKRIHFDYFLFEQLESPYAKIKTGVKLKDVRRITDGLSVTLAEGNMENEHYCKLLIGADGINSVVRKQLGNYDIEKKHYGSFVSAYFRGVRGLAPNNTAEIRIIRKNGMPLYFYIFPLPNDEFNISLGGINKQIKKRHVNLKEALREIIEEHPAVAPQFANAEASGKIRGWGIPIGAVRRQLVGDHYMLVGDAGGLVNPFYKEGIAKSMISGWIAAKHIDAAYQAQQFDNAILRQYERDFYRKCRWELVASNWLQKIAWSPWWFDRVLQIMNLKTSRRLTLFGLKKAMEIAWKERMGREILNPKSEIRNPKS